MTLAYLVLPNSIQSKRFLKKVVQCCSGCLLLLSCWSGTSFEESKYLHVILCIMSDSLMDT